MNIGNIQTCAKLSENACFETNISSGCDPHVIEDADCVPIIFAENTSLAVHHRILLKAFQCGMRHLSGQPLVFKLNASSNTTNKSKPVFRVESKRY